MKKTLPLIVSLMFVFSTVAEARGFAARVAPVRISPQRTVSTTAKVKTIKSQQVQKQTLKSNNDDGIVQNIVDGTIGGVAGAVVFDMLTEDEKSESQKQ